MGICIVVCLLAILIAIRVAYKRGFDDGYDWAIDFWRPWIKYDGKPHTEVTFKDGQMQFHHWMSGRNPERKDH